MTTADRGPELTVAQALVRFLAAQHVERDGAARALLRRVPGHLRPRQRRRPGPGAGTSTRTCSPTTRPATSRRWCTSPPATRVSATAWRTWACTTSVGPGATNIVTGAALATINRLPVLLLPGDTFATRYPHPVLQQLEVPHDATVSVNDCLRPVSRYYERVERPEQLIPAALEAMRVLTDPAETGAVTLAMPEDVQAEAFAVPAAFLAQRTWTVYRQPPARRRGARRRATGPRRASAAHRRRRWSHLLPRRRRPCGRSWTPRGSRWPRPRPDAARSSPITRSASARSAPPAPPPPTAWPGRPTWSSGSARGGATSPPPRSRPSRTPTCASSTST